MKLKKKTGIFIHKVGRLIVGVWNGVAYKVCGSVRFKENEEFKFWKKKAAKGPLKNKAYRDLFNVAFGINTDFYENKKVLDIGCGPRGTLEWADMASERIGLDPLVNSYKKLGIDRHKMKYIKAYSENIPFEDGYFDIVTSINSLDHVDDLDKTIDEIVRVTSPEGHFLLMVEVNHKPTKCEPISFSWDVVDKFLPKMKLMEKKCLEDVANGIMLLNVQKNVEYDHCNSEYRKGILIAKFIKVG